VEAFSAKFYSCRITRVLWNMPPDRDEYCPIVEEFQELLDVLSL
jgi:hypothetical protein